MLTNIEMSKKRKALVKLRLHKIQTDSIKVFQSFRESNKQCKTYENIFQEFKTKLQETRFAYKKTKLILSNFLIQHYNKQITVKSFVTMLFKSRRNNHKLNKLHNTVTFIERIQHNKTNKKYCGQHFNSLTF